MRHLVPRRGEVWLVDLGQTRGHQQAGRRPALVASAEIFNASAAGLVVVLPMTTTVRPGIRTQVMVEPPEGGVREPSAIKCEDIRSVSTERLVEPWGRMSERTLERVENVLRSLLELH